MAGVEDRALKVFNACTSWSILSQLQNPAGLRQPTCAIVMTVSTSHLCLITLYVTPEEARHALCQHFQSGTLVIQIFLQKELFSNTVDRRCIYYRSLQENGIYIAEKLCAISSTMAEEDQAITLQGSLSDSDSIIATALEAVMDDLSLSFARQACSMRS